MGLVEIFCGFDGEIVVDLQMFCGFDVEIMGDLQMQHRSNGLDGFADGWMGCGFCGFDGFAKVKSWCCNQMETNEKKKKKERIKVKSWCCN